MRSILKFAFVVVPTAALASGVVVAVSRNQQSTASLADGDLARDLKLASATSIELAPLGQPQATISAIEAPPSATPAHAPKLRKSSRGTRAVRSPRPSVKAAPEPEVAESAEEATTTEVVESAGGSAEATVVAPAAGGVALPRPTAIPVSFPGGSGGGMGTGDTDGGVYGGGGGVYGPGTVIRGGGVDGDHCQIHGGIFGPRRTPTTYPRTRGISLGDRIRAAQSSGGSDSRPRSIGERIRASQGRSSSSAGSSSSSSRGSSGGSLGGRIRAAQGRR